MCLAFMLIYVVRKKGKEWLLYADYYVEIIFLLSRNFFSLLNFFYGFNGLMGE